MRRPLPATITRLLPSVKGFSMRSLSSSVVVTLLLIGLTSNALGDEAKVKELKSQAEAALKQKQAAKQALDASVKKLQQANTALIQAKAVPARAKREQDAAEKQVKPQQDALKKADDANKKAAAAAKAASDAAAKEKGKPTEKAALDNANKAKAAAAKAKTDFEKAQAALKATQDTIAKSKDLIAKSGEAIKQAEAAVAAAKTERDKQQKNFDTVAAAWLSKQQAVEKMLIDGGQLVSFADKVAPIFAKRCLACHNARTAKGRLNMESFAAMMKGGESGAVVEKGDAESSNLWIMVDDGSMPKDADPLTKDEIALVKKWIDTGATLDAGKDDSAQLITIMPRFPQPNPPETYRVPIPVTAVAFSPDGKLLASSGYHEVLLWDAENGHIVRRITNVAERVYDIEFSADGKSVAVAAGTPAQIGETKIFNVADGKLLKDLVVTTDSVFTLAFSPDGKRLAAGGADRAIRIYDVASGEEQVVIEDHADWVMGVAWSPDGGKLASASRDKTSKVFDAKTGDSLITFNSHGQPVYDVGFTPDGKTVISCGEDKQIRVWNVKDAKQVRNIGGFGGAVFRIAFAKDKTYSSSADKTVKLHTPANGKALRTYSGLTDWVYSVAANESAKKLAGGSYDGKIRIWNADDGKELLTFTAAPGHTPKETASAK